MTFEQWWYDYRIKNQIGPHTMKEDIARAAWAAANIARPEGSLLQEMRECLLDVRYRINQHDCNKQCVATIEDLLKRTAPSRSPQERSDG